MKKTNLENLFDVSVILKLLHGIFEFLGGVVLFFISASAMADFFRFIFSKELTEDSGDFLANLLINLAHNISADAKSFIGIYFITFGVINSWIAFILLTKKIQHYIYVEIILAVFLVYEIYKFVISHSILILALIIIDSFILILIFRYHNFLLKGKG